MESKIQNLIHKINKNILNNKDLYKSEKENIKYLNLLLEKINMKGGLRKPSNKKKKSKKFNIKNVKNLKLNKRERNTHVNKDKLFEEKGILDPLGKEPNPLTGKPYENLYENENTYIGYAKNWSNLPMYKIRNEVLQTIYDNQVILIISGTGSGKTVLAPKLALHALNYQGKIMITNPKQIPTASAAGYAAKCLDVPLGKQVGYKYRGSDDSKRSKDTNLLYCTDGTVLAKLQNDPYLTEYDAIIIDEAHERNIRIDLLLLETKELLERRPDFKLIIMSATINPEIFINYFPKSQFKFAKIKADGKPNLPVKSIFLPKGCGVNKFDKNGILINRDYLNKMVDIIIEIIRTTDEGDILAFVTSGGDSQNICMGVKTKINELNNSNKERIFCTEYTGKSSNEVKKVVENAKMYKIRNNGYDRKLVVATEVAESSLTIDKLMFVVDSGLVLEQRYYPLTDIEALEKRYISKASHDQRLGRVGRTAPGTCYNVFTEEEYKKDFLDFSISPIKQENITTEVLKILNKEDVVSHVDLPFKYTRKRNNVGKDFNFPMSLNDYLLKLIEEPNEDTVVEIVKRLLALGALEKKDNKAYLTDIGRYMKKLDCPKVEMGRALLSSYDYNCANEMCNIAAFLELAKGRYESFFGVFKPDRKLNKNEQEKERKKDFRLRSKWASSEGDLITFLKAYNEYEERHYDKIDRKTNEVYEEKKGNSAGWCRNNNIKCPFMKRIRNTAKDYRRKLFGIVNYKKRSLEQNNKSNNKNKQLTLVYEEKPELNENKYKNILSALVDGFYVNMLRKNTKKIYMSCFPKKKLLGGIDNTSLYSVIKVPAKYLFYVEFATFINTSFRIVTPISPSEIKRIKDDKLKEENVHTCLSDATFEKLVKEKTEKKKQQSKSSKKKSYKKSHKKKYYKKKKFYKKK